VIEASVRAYVDAVNAIVAQDATPALDAADRSA